MRVYGWSNGTGGCGWYRVREPLRGMQLAGIETNWGPRLDDEIIQMHDTILTHILWQEEESEAWEILAKENQHRLVFDIDDDIWQYHSSTKNAKHYTPEVLKRVERNISIASLVTTPSEVLAERIIDKGLHDKVCILPNYVPAYLLEIERRTPRFFTIGYQGAPQHQIDLESIAVELFLFMKRHPNIRLRFYGPGEIYAPDWPMDRIQSIPWEPDVEKYYHSLSMHVGIAPLARFPFNEAKSGIRAVEYSALGIPAVYSDLPPYREFVQDGENGWLIREREKKNWLRFLSSLYTRPELYNRMSIDARKKAAFWTTEYNSFQWVGAYRSV